MYSEGITVVICTLNSEDDIEDVLLSLMHNSAKPNQIIVTDGGSTDNTCHIARKYTNDVYVSKKGFVNQLKNILDKIQYNLVLGAECDHRYPVNFIEDFVNERKITGYDILQASLVCNFHSNYWEKEYSYFYNVHQDNKGIKKSISGPSLWPADLFVETFGHLDNDIGFAIDTIVSDILITNSVVFGLGQTFAYQHQRLNYTIIKNKIFNYGIGDYYYYMRNKKAWSTLRKLSSLTHVFRKYFILHTVRSVVDKKLHFTPFFLLVFYWRYFGFLYMVLKKNKNSV
jgi:glycosyltransferase involved in cell wall biosynthesis